MEINEEIIENNDDNESKDELSAPDVTPSNEIDEDEKREKRNKKISKIISTVLSSLLLIFIGALLFRMCQANHKEFKKLNVSSAFKEAYAQSTDVRTHVAGEEFSNNGALYAYTYVYIEEAGYMQLTVRYNTRHIDEVVSALNENEKKLNPASNKTYTADDISIYYTVSDSNGNVYKDEINVLGKAEKYNYVFFQIELSCIDFSADSLSINMMLGNVKREEIDGSVTLVYSEGDSTSAGTSLTFHEKTDTYIPYKFSRKEKKALGIK